MFFKLFGFLLFLNLGWLQSKGNVVPPGSLKQGIIVSGMVRSAIDDQPLIGVTIVEKGTQNGTITDTDGKYSIVVGGNNAVLEFSFIGFNTEEVTVGDQTQINLVLIERIEALSEVVVIGYGTVKKSDLTGSVANVNPKVLDDLPVLSVEQALQGQAAGVQVTQNSGAPGESVMVRIRGMGTINNNNPLYVVDGAPVDAYDINFLNPNDIESLHVLKDASAAAIYGSRGANGVIVITTKRGKNNTMDIHFESYYGVQQITKSPDVMDAREFITFMQVNNLPGAKKYTDPEAYGAGFNWWDEITQPAAIQNYNFSILGGGDKSTFNFSIDYFDQDGAIKNTHFDRFSVRMNSELKPNKWFTLNENIALSKSRQNGSVEKSDWGNSVTGAYMADPMTEPYNQNGDFNGLFTKLANPMIRIDHDIPNMHTEIYRLIGSLGAQINFSENLFFNSNFSVNQKFDEQRNFYEEYVEVGQPGRPVSMVTQSQRHTSSMNWYNTLTFDFALFGNHNFKLMAGQEYQYAKYNSIPVQGDSIPGTVPEFQYVYISKSAMYTGSGNPWDQPAENALISYFGRLNYDFTSLFLFTATIRRDGSSRFGKEYKWGWFPSFAGAFKLSEFGFIRSIPQISLFKIRAGYGEVGNQEIGNYTWSSTFSSKQDYNDNETFRFGSALLTEANAAVHWESQNSYNVGTDLNLFENKLIFVADYFNKTTRGVLYPVELPLVMGLPNPSTQNIADIRNKGFEFSLNYRNMDHKLKFDIGVNFTHYDNLVIDLGGSNYMATNTYKSSTSARIDEGYPIGAFFGLKSDGLYKDWDDVAANGFKGSRPGDVKFIDLNGDRQLNNDDRMFIGSPHPDFTAGINLTLQYKQFELSSIGYSVIGNDIQFCIMDHIYSGTDSWNQSRDMLHAWTPVNSDSKIPRVGNTTNVRHPSDIYLFNGSFFRLNRLQLSYSLHPVLTQKIKLKKLLFYVSVQNLFTITKYPGMEPEIGLNTYRSGQLTLGSDGGTFPQPRTFLIGIKIKI